MIYMISRRVLNGLVLWQILLCAVARHLHELHGFPRCLSAGSQYHIFSSRIEAFMHHKVFVSWKQAIQLHRVQQRL